MTAEQGMKSTRDIVLSMLTETLDQGQFSHIVLNRTFSSYELNRQNKVFVGRLFHGVLEQSLFLDWIISSYSSVKLNKIKPVIRNILRMSIYQMLFMDSVPDHAAINEAVKLAKSRGLKGLVPFVNGLLRAFQRGGIKAGMPENVKHSVPLWLYDLEVKELGKNAADAFFDAMADPNPHLFARMDLEKSSPEEILRLLEEDGCKAERVDGTPEALCIHHVSDLTGLTAFQKGLLYIQDLSSMHVGKIAAELSKGKTVETILDVCAAPGGKSLHLAEKFPKAQVLARDLSEEKVELIRDNIRRSGRENLCAEAFDALVLDEKLIGKMDIVLADLPCSGLGVIGRKPDIRLRVTEQDIISLSKLQKEILSVVWQYVKPGGLLLYSTCTVDRKENQENAEWIRTQLPFEMLYEKLFLSGKEEGDGFYLTAFCRREDK